MHQWRLDRHSPKSLVVHHLELDSSMVMARIARSGPWYFKTSFKTKYFVLFINILFFIFSSPAFIILHISPSSQQPGPTPSLSTGLLASLPPSASYLLQPPLPPKLRQRRQTARRRRRIELLPLFHFSIRRCRLLPARGDLERRPWQLELELGQRGR